jgi:hypothetical protein
MNTKYRREKILFHFHELYLTHGAFKLTLWLHVFTDLHTRLPAELKVKFLVRRVLNNHVGRKILETQHMNVI